MIKEETIGSVVFVEQTTFYIYENEEAHQKDHAYLRTSDKKKFDSYKKQIRKKVRGK